MIYTVYKSKHNKESLNTLKYGMTLSDFLDLKEYVDVMESIDDARGFDHDQELKRMNEGT